jgi:hypothetical protein
MFTDDVYDSTKILDRSYLRKIHPHFVNDKPRFVQSGAQNYYPNAYYNIRVTGNDDYTSVDSCSDSGLCFYGFNKENLLPPYEYTKNNFERPSIPNQYMPLAKSSNGRVVGNDMTGVNFNPTSVGFGLNPTSVGFGLNPTSVGFNPSNMTGIGRKVSFNSGNRWQNKNQIREYIPEVMPRLQRLRTQKHQPNGEWTIHGFRKYDIRNYQIDPDLEEKMKMHKYITY